MKKAILILSFLFLYFITNAQETIYKAVVTEMYVKDKTTNEWSLYSKSSNTNILVVVEDEFITFQAKSPSMYKIYLDTKQPLQTKSMSGSRYDAKDLKRNIGVKLDILSENTGSLILISIVNEVDEVNLRFFLNISKNTNNPSS